ncbi:hypothetical protein OG402_41800 [Streptomyces anulatus]|uniref:hypothetical protein n=1 Tax=Streptomyces TaxID=1883 RepID=UPI000BF137D9|nr:MULTISPECIES: hypothetical protein [Streptomyces]MCX4606961.1 hypothetical protein [Streptomyces anulatus]MDF9801468.1 hypothetical protein [Streptomyces sp. HB372]WTD30577.1 hypothetical protein OH737_39060 [Streptomyces anulatus]WUC92069.1 hypothetical protein OHQ35_38880 [Streptomyces anulatus]
MRAVTEARAWAWAFNGNAEQTLAAVGRARDCFRRAGPVVEPWWIGWFDRPELETQAAWACAVAGLAGPGIQVLKEALDLPGA